MGNNRRKAGGGRREAPQEGRSGVRSGGCAPITMRLRAAAAGTGCRSQRKGREGLSAAARTPGRACSSQAHLHATGAHGPSRDREGEGLSHVELRAHETRGQERLQAGGWDLLVVRQAVTAAKGRALR